MNLWNCGAMCCAMRGHFRRETNGISTCMSLSPFARGSKMRNGCEPTRAKAAMLSTDRSVGTKADPSHHTYRGPVRARSRGNRWPTYPNLQLLPMNADRDIGARYNPCWALGHYSPRPDRT